MCQDTAPPRRPFDSTGKPLFHAEAREPPTIGRAAALKLRVMGSRRDFLKACAALGAAAAAHARAAGRVRFTDNPFKLGVASGYPRPDGAVIWTRLAGDLDPVAIPVRWEIGADEAMRAIVASGAAEAPPAWAHSVHVELSGLEPDPWY